MRKNTRLPLPLIIPLRVWGRGGADKLEKA